MGQFLQKNRKKGLAAAVLLFLQRGKGTVPLITMVALLATIFVVPTDVILGLPVIGPFAKRLGLSSQASRGAELAALTQSLNSTRKLRYLDTPGAIFGRGGKGAGAYGESTVGLVVGDRRDAAKGGDGAHAEAGAQGHDMVGAGDELDGANALDADEARDLDDAMKLDNSDLIKTIGAGAQSGDGDGKLKPVADFGNLKGYRGAGDGGGVGGRVGVVNPDDGMVSSALNDTDVPGTGRSASLRGVRGVQGKLRGRSYRKLSAMVGDNMGTQRGLGRKTAMYQLAEGRAYSIASAPPPGKCDPSGDCPGEYAKNVAGTSFDGSEPAGGILTATDLGEASSPNVPSQGTIDTLTNDANQTEEDALKCEEANEKYGPLIDEKNAEIDAQSQELNNTQCDGSGGCSQSKANRCFEIEGRMKQTCRELNDLQRQWAQACPLSDGKYDEMKCTR